MDVRLFNTALRDKNDIMTEIFRSKAILLGSPTINKGILTSTASLIEEIKGLRFRKKKAAVFGTYGWSGESVPILEASLKEAGFEIIQEGSKILWEPDEQMITQATAFGKVFAQKTTATSD